MDKVKVFLFYVGKPRDRHANAMAAEFLKRASRYARCEMREIHPARFDPWKRHPSALRVALDPDGAAMDSAAFIRMMEQAGQTARDIVFLVGGADGLPEGWAARSDQRISLSPMTFPHELARVMLAEQIYRAFTTLRGHPYPR